MKRTLKVDVDAIKHERDKNGDLFTTLHLELPDNTELRYLQRAYRITRRKGGRETAKFTLRIYGAGDRRTWIVTSRGSKTKNFKVVAVVEAYFNASARFERYLDPAERDAFDVELDVEIEEPVDPTPLFPKKHDDPDEGLSA